MLRILQNNEPDQPGSSKAVPSAAASDSVATVANDKTETAPGKSDNQEADGVVRSYKCEEYWTNIS